MATFFPPWNLALLYHNCRNYQQIGFCEPGTLGQQCPNCWLDRPQVLLATWVLHTSPFLSITRHTQMEEPTGVRADNSTLVRNTAFLVGTETSLCPPCFPLRPSEGWCWAGGARENYFLSGPGIHYRNYPQALIFLETKPIAGFPEGLAASPLQLRELTPGLLV